MPALKRHRFNQWQTLVAALLLCAAPVVALAQDAGKAARDLALYTGADRTDKLLELAKKEGELSVYHVYPALPAVIAAFTKKTGIKVKVWRSGSEAVLQRVTAESRGGRHEVDIVQNNAPEAEATWREKLLQEVASPFSKDLMPGAVPAHQGWVGFTLDIWTAAYNTNAVKKEDLPKSYADLADPRWKGKLAIEANNHAWFGTLMAELGEAQGQKLFDNIVASNGIGSRKGHSVLANLVASGDVGLGLTVYSWIPEQLKKKGAPIENHVILPLLAQPSTIAVMKRAPNPASALLLYDFMISPEGQKVLADNQFVPTSRVQDNPLAKLPIKFLDPNKVLDMQDKWLKTFEDTIIKKAR
jgi:iron(III) transport system substrate-binding protein